MSNGKLAKPQSAEADLPDGWTLVRVSEVCEVNPRKPAKDALPDDALVTFVPMSSVDEHLGVIAEPEERPFGDLRPRSYTAFAEGDVLLAKITPCFENGKVALAEGLSNDLGFGSTEFHVFRSTGAILPEYLYRYFRQKSFRDRGKISMTGTSGHLRVPTDYVKEFQLPLSPLAEQKRIVAKVEGLLEKVNAAQAKLARMPAVLKRFRQSVLAAACSGQLTDEWRDGTAMEATTQLLARLREAVPSEAELAVEFPAKRWRVATPQQPQHDDLPSIPESWSWVYLPSLGYMNRGRSRTRPRNAPYLYDGKYPFIQTGDIAQSGGRIVSHKQTYNEAGLAQSRLWPAGTICITIAANIADSAILTYPACFPDSVVGLIPDSELCIAEFAEFFIRTAREDLSQFAPATAQKNINVSILGEVAVPLPPLEEQHEIVHRVETLFALAEGIEAHVRDATIQAERLPQAILARAFRGELVPTEAELAAREGRDYEPASTLLAMIQEAREQHKPAKRGHGGKNMARRSTGRQTTRKRRPLDEVLREQGEPLATEELFSLGGFDQDSVDEFYEELGKLVEAGTIRENRPNSSDVTLEVARL